MTETFNAMRIRSRGQPIEWGGRLVHGSYKRPLGAGEAGLVVERLSVGSPYRTGLRLSLTAGELDINGDRDKEFILWADTSPPRVPVRCTALKEGCQLIV